jgi:hypothetical protein
MAQRGADWASLRGSAPEPRLANEQARGSAGRFASQACCRAEDGSKNPPGGVQGRCPCKGSSPDTSDGAGLLRTPRLTRHPLAL